ncbi:hypothetical protein CEXT_552481 [Caerostris extrusa]|uniref:RRM domain-containing protein n=1 Tax=Caerostris extrusa TaxID=172846 RepID=A0AAV4N5C8_CAEEX|nr:hypothetical protein CEXT_552481 [Caerostris extrusa]
MNDYRVALTLNGKMIGHRYITISVASKESLAIARGSNYPPQKPRSPPHASGPPHGFLQGPKDVLPGRVTNDDIANFFRDTAINIRAFHIMLNADKLPNGDAFIEVPNKRDADAALRKTRKK